MFKSWIFIPGSKDKYLKKTEYLAADAFIYDLEDSVADQEKENARLKVAKHIQKTKEKVNFVRVNHCSVPYFIDELSEIVNEGLNGIVLPKASSKEDIMITDYLLTYYEKKYELKSQSITIIPIIESALGLHNVYDIATSSKRVTRLAFGAEDFMLDLNISTNDEETEILYARSKLVSVSRTAKLDAPIDTVYPDFSNAEGLERTALKAKRLGFQGKLIIHPNQIEIVNRVFSPTAEEINEAKRILEYFNESFTDRGGAVQINGKMVDIPIAERARKIIAYDDQH